MVVYGWLEIAGHVQIWPEIAENSWKWLDMTEKGLEDAGKTGCCRTWLEIVQNIWKWLEMV